MSSSKKSKAQEAAAETAVEQPNNDAPAAAEAEQSAEAAAEPEADEAAAEEGDDNALAEINAAERPMRAADGEGSCDRYKSDKAGNILVPASEVPHMLEHGFVLVDADV